MRQGCRFFLQALRKSVKRDQDLVVTVTAAEFQQKTFRQAALPVFVCRTEKDLIAHVEDMGGITDSRGDIMRNHHDGHTFLIQPADQVIHFRSHFGVQTGDRLVHQQNPLGSAQSPRQQDTLLLTAGQLTVAAPGQRCYPHPLHILPDQFLFRPAVERPSARTSLASGQNDFPHRGREVLLHHRLLRKVSDLVLP